MIGIDQLAGMNIHYLYYSLENFLQYQQKIGITAIELWGGCPHVFMDSISYSDCARIRKLASAYDQRIIAFTPESIIYPYNVAAPEAMQWEKSKGYFSNAVKATAELGSKIMTINSGYGLENEDVSESWKRSREMLSFLSDIADSEGIEIALETLRPEESKIVTTLQGVQRMLSEVRSEQLKPMIDCTALTVAGEDLEDWFESFGDEIVHMHFIDATSNGGHLAWGDGELNLFESLLKLNKYEYSGYLGQEITDLKYFEKPFQADQQVVESFKKTLKLLPR